MTGVALVVRPCSSHSRQRRLGRLHHRSIGAPGNRCEGVEFSKIQTPSLIGISDEPIRIMPDCRTSIKGFTSHAESTRRLLPF